MNDPDRSPDPPPPDRQAMEDFEDVERITRAFVHWSKWSLIAGLPIWLVLLVVVPATGLGSIGSLALSTLLAAAAVVLAERRWGRRSDAGGDTSQAGPRRVRDKGPMSPLRAVFLTLAAVVAVIYVIFIIVTIARGG
jgi:hypothetical protein